MPFLVYGVISNLKQNVSNKAVNFQLATSVYKCNVADLSKISTIDEASVDNINTKCVLTLSDSGANPTVGGESLGTITRTAGINANLNDERAIFAFALPVSDEADARTITVKRNGKKQTANFTKTAIAPAKSFNAVFAFSKPVAIPAFDYVEIGDRRWATMNYGASTIAGDYETCAGDFYEWGGLELLYDEREVELRGEGVVWNYSWKDPINKNPEWGYKEYLYPDFSSMDMLPDERDVIKQNHADWRTPTLDDVNNLFIACGWSGYRVNKNTTGDAIITYCTPQWKYTERNEGGIYFVGNTEDDWEVFPEYDGIKGVVFISMQDTTKRIFIPSTAADGDVWIKIKDCHDSGIYNIVLTPSLIWILEGGDSDFDAIRPVQDIIDDDD